MRGLRYFYAVYFGVLLILTVLNLGRVLSRKAAIKGSFAVDFLMSLAWPALFFSQSGRSYIRSLIKG